MAGDGGEGKFRENRQPRRAIPTCFMFIKGKKGAYKMLPYAGVGLGLLFEDGDADAETMCLVTFGGNVASAIGQNRLTVAAET